MANPAFLNDGFGFLGDVRRFELDGVQWEAFEFRRPIAPFTRSLTLANGKFTKTVIAYPADWRSLSPAELLERIR